MAASAVDESQLEAEIQKLEVQRQEAEKRLRELSHKERNVERGGGLGGGYVITYTNNHDFITPPSFFLIHTKTQDSIIHTKALLFSFLMTMN
jgi:hypothetical protein